MLLLIGVYWVRSKANLDLSFTQELQNRRKDLKKKTFLSLILYILILYIRYFMAKSIKD